MAQVGDIVTRRSIAEGKRKVCITDFFAKAPAKDKVAKDEEESEEEGIRKVVLSNGNKRLKCAQDAQKHEHCVALVEDNECDNEVVVNESKEQQDKLSIKTNSSESSSTSSANEPVPRLKTESKRKVNPEYLQSLYRCVFWRKDTEQWVGQVNDVLAQRSSTDKRNSAKIVRTKHFPKDQEYECACAVAKLEAEIEAKNDAILKTMAAQDPLTRYLERAPKNVLDAQQGIVYWRANKQDNFRPTRMLLAPETYRKRGQDYCVCCHHIDPQTGEADCMKKAYSGLRFCYQHSEQRDHICDIEGCTHRAKTLKDLRVHKKCVHGGELQHACKSNDSETGTECPYEVNGQPKYNGYCTRCFISKFPEDAKAINAKAFLHAKELSVREFLQTVFPETGSPGYRWAFDRTISVGKLVRPDARVALSTQRILIVEIDEDSHNTYSCANERERERIFKKHAPQDAVVHVIRFNPDAYDDPVTGKRIPTCFTYSKEKNMASVPKSREKDWKARLECLRKVIQEIIDHEHEDIQVPMIMAEEDERYRYVVPIELFYDNVRVKWPNDNKGKRTGLKHSANMRSKAKAMADPGTSASAM